jgi:competence protein ComEC
MKKLVVSLFTLSMFLVPLSQASASPGGTDSNGGHTCYTNCAQYGLESGEYHFHDDNGDIVTETPEPTTPIPSKPQGLFTDTAGHWAETNINLLYNKDLVGGYSDGSFGVKKSITRAEVATIITRHLGLETSKPSFEDVSSKHWAYSSIGAVSENEIMGGYKDGSFKPNEPVTRAELSALLTRAYDLSGKSSLDFSDLSTKHWAYEAIQILVNNEIAGGYPDNTFKPNAYLNRAEFATFLANIIKNNDTNIAGGEITASFINVGQGDSILIETPNHKNILIDGGDRYAGDEVINYLNKKGVSSIDLMVATHPDADHIGGLVDVLAKFPVKKVLDSGKTHTTETYKEYLALINQKNIPMEVAKVGSTISLDNGIQIKVLNGLNSNEDSNDSSIVLKVTYGTVDFILTGDAGVENEEKMVANYNVEAEILKVGHHGSDTSTSQAFVNEIDPEVAVLSYGENSYGHPDSGVVSRLKNAGAKLYSTYENGDIVVTTDGSTYNVEGALN